MIDAKPYRSDRVQIFFISRERLITRWKIGVEDAEQKHMKDLRLEGFYVAFRRLLFMLKKRLNRYERILHFARCEIDRSRPAWTESQTIESRLDLPNIRKISAISMCNYNCSVEKQKRIALLKAFPFEMEGFLCKMEFAREYGKAVDQQCARFSGKFVNTIEKLNQVHRNKGFDLFTLKPRI